MWLRQGPTTHTPGWSRDVLRLRSTSRDGGARMTESSAGARSSGHRIDAGDIGEPRWPMAVAVLATGGLHAVLAPALRSLPPELLGESRWAYLVVVAVLLGILIVGDPGRIDREAKWLRVVTIAMIALISLDTVVVALRLASAILNARPFTEDPKTLLLNGSAIWLSAVIAFALWYWEIDRGGPVGRARGPGGLPAFQFPEMGSPELVKAGWYPRFIDYLHMSFGTSTSFGPSDVSAIASWAKFSMMVESFVSLVIAVLVIGRAVNLLK